MNYAYPTQGVKQMNYLIQQRLNKRFENNSDLMYTFQKYTISPNENLNLHSEQKQHTRILQESDFVPTSYMIPTSSPDRYSKIQPDEQIRQSITIPLNYNPVNDYSFVLLEARYSKSRFNDAYSRCRIRVRSAPSP